MRYLLHHLLESSARSRPQAVAVVDRGRTLSYEQLDRQANRVANLLRDRGVAKGDRVGLFLDKSLESVVGIYGALKAGAAYVPFDASAPASRLAYIAKDCGIRCLLTGAAEQTAWIELLGHGAPIEQVVVLDADRPATGLPDGVTVAGAAEVESRPDNPPAVTVIDADLAYILYTSGSTGDPKGVMLSHRNALSFVEWAAEEFGVRSDDRLSSHAPLHFDLSVFDLFAAAWAGARVVLVPAATSVFPVEVARFIRSNAITVWYSVPSILTMLTLRGGLTDGDFPQLRTLLFAGEVFPTRYLRRLQRRVPHVRLANLYGPTETNVCTYYDVPRLPDDAVAAIPIGKAIANVETFVAGDDGQPVPTGTPGELYVRGPTVMRGYWGHPERTARVRQPNPFVEGPGDPVYRTGDLVVAQDDDGTLRFLGRRDAQIKSRGYRIELGDVESALYAHPGVVECAVVAVPDELVTNRIKAVVVVRDGTTREQLVQACAERVPRYMVPDAFEFRGALAKTSTGKIDRRSLQPSAASG